jgi:hypothetical protein
MYIADGDYIKDIEVNDLRNRYTLTKGATQKMVKLHILFGTVTLITTHRFLLTPSPNPPFGCACYTLMWHPALISTDIRF